MNYTKNNDNKILWTLKDSYYEYLASGSRSNKKLKILHGAIANDLKQLLPKQYTIVSLSTDNSQEVKIKGKYYDKVVDIAIQHENKIVGVVGIKFVMQNYAQNANNYFENLLGETVNIQLHDVPYFNMLFLQKRTPYFLKGGELKKLEQITEKVLQKYFALYEQNSEQHFHVPKLFFLGILSKENVNLEKVKEKKRICQAIFSNKRKICFQMNW